MTNKIQQDPSVSWGKEYPPLLAEALNRLGIFSPHEASAFLSPLYERDVHDPFLLTDMEKATERIIHALGTGERIAVYADFDCDGIPGAVVIQDFFQKIGYNNFEVYIPHRNREGFGFHAHAVEELATRGVSLIITVDCGINGVHACARARTFGIDVIITDHHLPEEHSLEAYAIVNPNAAASHYPNKALCGAGVAFQLVRALLARGAFGIVPGWEKWLLDLVGLATIADMVSLREPENRALAHFGLTVLRKSPRPGIQQLLRKVRVDQRTLTEEDIGFSIAPRLNAASRMDAPEDAFRLLATKNQHEAETLVEHLEKLNRKRKTHVALIVKEANARLSKRKNLGSVIVMGNPNWQPSLLGLAANSLAETHRRPVFLWGRDEMRVLKGSCRSDGETDVVALMRSSSHTFIEYGGHAYSGGFSLSLEHVATLEDALVRAHAAMKHEQGDIHIIPKGQGPVLSAPTTLDMSVYELLAQLAPFGVGNPRPVFSLSATVRTIHVFGAGDVHRKIILNEYPLPVIAFFAQKYDRLDTLTTGATFTYPVALELSAWGGRRELRLRVV